MKMWIFIHGCACMVLTGDYDLTEEETIDDIEFELGYRGWRLLCHMKREYPYMIKYRLISSSPKSVSIKPKDFIQRAIKVLNH